MLASRTCDNLPETSIFLPAELVRLVNEIPDETMELIRSHILQGEKIQACKVYKEATGSSLLEAKNQVEMLTEELRSSHPDQMTDRSPVGCLSVLILGFICTGGIAIALILS